MRSDAPVLMPTFRTQTQGELLALVLDLPEREWTISELATLTGAALTSIQSEVARLESAQILVSRKVGRNRLVKANLANPVVAPLTQVALYSFGPRPIIAREFAELGADAVILFGSWPARLAGEPGPIPTDIDVLVVGDSLAREDVYAAAERAEAQLGRPVNPVLRTSKAWRHPEQDPLLDEILRQPFIDVTRQAETL